MKSNDNNINFKSENQITGKMKLKLDKDFSKLMEASQKTGVPLTFMGDRIIDFKINGRSKYDFIKPDKIVISPSAINFDLKWGDKYYKEIPFDRQVITENVIIFKTTFYANFPVVLKMRFKFDEENNKFNANFSLNPKSNKIKDILNYEMIKKECDGNNFEIKLSEDDKYLFKGNFSNNQVNENYLKFYKKVDKINDYLNLNICLKEDYVVINKDAEIANAICEFIKYKKIKLETFKISLEIFINQLEKILMNNQQFLLKQDNYVVTLLDNEVNLGSYQIYIDEYEILNKDELIDILNSNKYNENPINISIILKSTKDDLYLDFSK